MTGMHSDPEKLFALADQVLGEPLAYMQRATQTVTSQCSLDAMAFGIFPGSFMGPAYNSAQQAFVTTLTQGTGLVSAMATALANVAKVHGAAEGANDLSAPSVSLPPTGIGSYGSLDGFAAEGITLIVAIGLFTTFAAIAGVCSACAALTPAALISVAAWELTEPIDDEITRAISGWQSAKIDVSAAKDSLDGIVGHLDDGWSSDDSARPAFDSWWALFDGDLDQLKDGIDKIPDKLQDAMQELHTIHETLFVAALAAMAALIALTGLDVFFGAGEAAKVVTAIGLNAGVWVCILDIVAVLVTTTGFMIDLGSKASGFNVSNPGDHTLPDFTQLEINQVTVPWNPPGP